MEEENQVQDEAAAPPTVVVENDEETGESSKEIMEQQQPSSVLSEGNYLPQFSLTGIAINAEARRLQQFERQQLANAAYVPFFPNGFRPNSNYDGRFAGNRQSRFNNGFGGIKKYPVMSDHHHPYLTHPVVPSQEDQNHRPVKQFSSIQCLKSVMESVTENSRRKLEEYEFYPNWMNTKSDIQLNQYELDGMLSFLRNEGHEMHTADNGELKLRIFGLAPLICNNAQAFLKIVQGDYVGADECLAENNRLIDICLNSQSQDIIAKDYITGLFYIIKGLKIIVESQMGTLGKDFDLDGFICTEVETFSHLPIAAKVAVWASKHFFLKLIRHKGPLVYKEMNELVFLDPDYYEWRIYHYLAIREDRRKRHGNLSNPEKGEIQALQHAWNLSPRNPFCLVYMALGVAECLRSRPFVSQDRPLSFGQFDFMSLNDAIDFIKLTCMNMALKINPQCIRVNLLIAHILSFLLPVKHREFNMARECVFMAYRFGQETSSKANHRLALYMLQNLKTSASSPQMCEVHFEKAFNLDNRNVEALFSLIEVYLSKPREFEPKIRMLFSINLHNMDLTDESMAKLNFLKGCFHLMIQEFDSGLNCWVTAYNLKQAGGLNFKMLQTNSYVYRLFCWPYDKINLHTAILETKKGLGSLLVSTSPESCFKKKTILMEILELQKDALSNDAGNSDIFVSSAETELHRFQKSLAAA